MRFTQSWLAIGALVVMGAFAVDSTAKASLEERIEHIKLLLENKVTIETLNEIESLKTDVQSLHGKIDEQQHAIELLKQRQEKLFLDLEQRINQAPKTISSATYQSGKYVYPKQQLAAPSEQQHGANVTTNVDVTKSTEKSASELELPKTEAITKINSSASEQRLYNEAYKLVEAKRYKDALIALQDFLWKFPDGQYTANANYWLGEIYLSEWHDGNKVNSKDNKTNLEKSIEYFKTVANKYAKHHKAADSLLKLGIIESEQGNWPAAKEYFTELKQQYPGSTRAHMADARLKKLK
jgi:tol-pal system protein YbgF